MSMTPERFEEIRNEFKRLTPLMEAVACGSSVGNDTPLHMWGETIRALKEVQEEADRLRKHAGIKALEETQAELERTRLQLAACGVVARANTPESANSAREMCDDWKSASCDDVARAVDREMSLRVNLAAWESCGLTEEMLRKGHDRYETSRRLSPAQWADAWKLNISTGKPFDEIIDDLRPFVRP